MVREDGLVEVGDPEGDVQSAGEGGDGEVVGFLRDGLCARRNSCRVSEWDIKLPVTLPSSERSTAVRLRPRRDQASPSAGVEFVTERNSFIAAR